MFSKAQGATAVIDPLLKLAAVVKATGLSRSTIYRMMNERRFPRPVQLGPNSVRWRESHISKWIENLEVNIGNNVTRPQSPDLATSLAAARATISDLKKLKDRR
jgi:prophage regulatory protein